MCTQTWPGDTVDERSTIKVYVKQTIPLKRDLHSHLYIVVNQKIRFQSPCEMTIIYVRYHLYHHLCSNVFVLSVICSNQI